MHRRAGECLDPATLGLTEVRRIWRRPTSAADLARLKSLGLAAERNAPRG